MGRDQLVADVSHNGCTPPTTNPGTWQQLSKDEILALRRESKTSQTSSIIIRDPSRRPYLVHHIIENHTDLSLFRLGFSTYCSHSKIHLIAIDSAVPRFPRRPDNRLQHPPHVPR